MTSLSVPAVPVRSAVTDSRDASAAPPAPTELIKLLEPRYEVSELRDEHRTRTALDTSDRRVAGAGATLWFERSARRLVLERPGDSVVVQESGSVAWPARLEALPDGPVRRTLAKPVGLRALLPFAELRVSTTSYAVLNADGKSVARLHRARGRLDGRELPDRLEVERLRGYGAEADWVAKRLRLGSGSDAGPAWAAAVRAVPVPGEPPAASAAMTVDQPAAVAVAGALLDNLAAVESSVDGIRRDLDIEYLHDFRVAVRRSRSVLKLLGDALPDGLAERAAPELRWLGQVTTVARDLDVYVAELPELGRSLVRPEDLEAFARHVQAKRKLAYASLRRSLRTQRFSAWCTQWRVDLETVITDDRPGAVTAAQLADERLHRTFRKVVRRARAIGPGSEAEEIHDLRKACKELRYLLEVFRPLCDPAAFKALTADFKGLQDVLGDFQDGEVQAAALRDFAEEMLRERSAGAPTLLAMGELAGQFDERQRAARVKLLDQHLTHLGRSVASHIDHVVATRGAR